MHDLLHGNGSVQTAIHNSLGVFSIIGWWDTLSEQKYTYGLHSQRARAPQRPPGSIKSCRRDVDDLNVFMSIVPRTDVLFYHPSVFIITDMYSDDLWYIRTNSTMHTRDFVLLCLIDVYDTWHNIINQREYTNSTENQTRLSFTSYH